MNNVMHSCVLKKDKESSVLRKHPWIFSGAIDRISEDIPLGATLDVFAQSGTWLCKGAYSPQSQIRIRTWTFDPKVDVGNDFFAARIAKAHEYRSTVHAVTDSAYRLINGESDGLPGLIVDVYGQFLVCQFLAAGVEYFKDTIIANLVEKFSPTGIYERSDADVRLKEGLQPRCGVLYGESPPTVIDVNEGELVYLVDVVKGHKTGMYLDQKENRKRVGTLCEGKEVLNCFSYTGGFGLAALVGGATRVVNLDASEDALTLAKLLYERNGVSDSRAEFLCGDVFKVLRNFRNEAKSFDCIILDPPKFAESRVQLEGACRGYKDINLLAFKLIRAGGMLVTFSCSGLMVTELFQKIVADAALDSGKTVRIVERLFASADHPVGTAFPEGTYLKGFVCHVE